MTTMTHSLMYARASVIAAALLLPAGLEAQAQAPPANKPTTTVDASRGGITISSGPNSLSIGARMQFRWTLDDRDQADADTTGTGRGRQDGVFSQFDVPRMRVTLGGGVYQPWLRYSFQFEFSRTSGAGASKIKDAIIEIRPTGRAWRVQMGQFKAPFGLQQLTSSGRQQFVDRAITDGKYTPGRDMGAMFTGTAAAQKFGYQVGAFNGSGESLTQTNRAHLVAGRVFVNPMGAYALAEGSTDSGARPVLHFGVGARTGKQIRGRTTAGVVEDPDNQTALNLEFAYKQSRFYSTAEYFWMTEEQQNPVAGPDLDSQGFHVQAGYMLAPRTTEIGIRYAAVEGNTAVSNAAVREVRGVVGYFWRAHNLKLQADVGQLRYDAGYAGLSARARSGLPSLGTRLVSGQRLADNQVRVQMQVAF
jgi:phosphate-selective porin OprO and OprP